MAVYEIRPEVGELCRDVILELYNFIDMADEAMLDLRTVEKIRNQITKRHDLQPPRNIELLEAYKNLIKEGSIEANDTIFGHLVKRKIRSLSGIANITVLMKAWGCPGKCIFCPTQPGMPKSYFSDQPAMLRAVRNNFDAYKQVKTRLNGLQTQGHDTSKIDIRTAGGTWSSYPVEYQEFFVKSIYFALNEGPGPFLPEAEVISLIENTSLSDLIERNETAASRCVGLWVETRPDWVTEDEIKRLRNYGVTGIELGIQSTNDQVNEFNERGHGLAESIQATQMCRDAGLKICHHIMPNLPTATIQNDLQSIRDLFGPGNLEPDYIKVYPCMVTPFTKLAKMVEADPSIHTPYTEEQLLNILTEIINLVPEYCRVIRILRDFPSELILQGSKKTNLRQILESRGVTGRDIRAREIKGEDFNPEDVELVTRSYQANNGTEHFLSLEDTKQDKLIGLCRLRLPTKSLEFLPELKDCALIRELHVYGTQKGLKPKKGSALESQTQHKGYGKQLMAQAEAIAKAAGYPKLAVISAIGTREYYRKLGYSVKGTYMTKGL